MGLKVIEYKESNKYKPQNMLSTSGIRQKCSTLIKEAGSRRSCVGSRVIGCNKYLMNHKPTPVRQSTSEMRKKGSTTIKEAGSRDLSGVKSN